MLRSTLPALLALAALLLASGCDIERPQLDDAVITPTANTA